MIRTVIVRTVATLTSALLTDRFIINAVVILLEWLARRTKNDLDNQLVQALKDSLDKSGGRPANLYEELRDR